MLFDELRVDAWARRPGGRTRRPAGARRSSGRSRAAAAQSAASSSARTGRRSSQPSHARALGLRQLGQPRSARGPRAACRAAPRPGRSRRARPATGSGWCRQTRPPIFLYSTRSGPRPARSHSAAQSWTSARRSPISPGPGPRSGTSSGAHAAPARKARRAARATSGARPRARPPGGSTACSRPRPWPPQATAAAAGDAEGAGDPLRLVLLDRQRPQPGVAGRRVVDETDRGHVRLDDVDLLQRGDDQQLQAEPLEQLEREPGRLIGPAAERLVDDHEPEGP